jgi:hypothetical protein
MDLSQEVNEDSWTVAYDVVKTAATIPANLPHIMRACWNDLMGTTEFVRLLGSPGIPARCLIRAAHLPQRDEQPQAPELTAAVEILGPKAAAVMLAINCICERTLDSGPANRIWSPLFKEMMSEIEIGYHFGTTVQRVGHERGMLIGFSRLSGLALLLIRFPEQFVTWYTETGGKGTPQQALKAFGCEPYQVSSILMQHLGLGTDVALVTASTLGNLDNTVVEVKPTMQSWRATFRWLQALKNGEDAPSCEESRQTFAELCVAPGETRVPHHIALLHEQVAEVRKSSSRWTWHLPLPTYEETAKAIVYRVNANTCGTTWTKGLVVGATPKSSIGDSRLKI